MLVNKEEIFDYIKDVNLMDEDLRVQIQRQIRFS